MADNEDRAAVLARRKYFIASALAGIATVACDRPAVCLDVVAAPTGSTTPTTESASATPSTSTDAPKPPHTADAEEVDAAPPMPCLEIAPQPPPSTMPRVCLRK
jgi:hypothetical protein